MSWLYLALNAAVISIPLAFSWHGELRFVDRWRAFFPACLLVLLFFIAWDIPFAAWGVWGFDDRYLLGPRIAGLPLEEWLFFLCIPYACVFTYHCLARLSVQWVGDGLARGLTAGVGFLALVLAIIYWGRLYTTTTCVLVALFAGWMVWKRPPWIPGFWTAYLVLLVPFVGTNGVLTGVRFWQYPLINTQPQAVVDHVVWYDNAQNLAVRFLSIPLDDFLYAFLLIGLNVALLEYFSSRDRRESVGRAEPTA
ncbi:MAG: lycopene cyclase domain-containing protein [Rhodothermales bacterium]|nr:lycopene cyclase domain-containing protein [Rhodothermales bacterium]MBO6778594.1 lycopene cyclase domain-containing protein [Rhodothermales bacterium]